jgi:RNA polymerase sigma-B factor
VRAPRRVQELYLSLGPLIEELSQRLGCSPTVRQLAAESGQSEEAVLEALEAAHAYRSASLDAPAPEGDSLGSRLGEIDADFLTVENRTTLIPQLATLPRRERLILQLRFVDGLTQSEIAARLGLSQMQISRLLSRSLAILHDAFGVQD